MADYIEREVAVKAAIDGADEWDGGYNRNRDSYIECSIDNVPAADVAEVRHGHWELIDKHYRAQDGWEYRRYRCSLCHRTTVEPDNYCSHCGAKMDESEDEDNG